MMLTAIRDQFDTLLDEDGAFANDLARGFAFLVTREIARRDERRISIASKIAQSRLCASSTALNSTRSRR
ncbi:hypothetical protein [Mesorhizobium sp. M0674]|uniref:hypothetical protein n=1 Tax=unclassified Mesorhizobium TaxID=325217 RepID=UPI00333A5933